MTSSSGPTVDVADARASTRAIEAPVVRARACRGRSAAENTLAPAPRARGHRRVGKRLAEKTHAGSALLFHYSACAMTPRRSSKVNRALANAALA
jgi:hypothetical protein